MVILFPRLGYVIYFHAWICLAYTYPPWDSHGSCENHRLWTIWALKINTPSRSISPLMGLGCIQSKQLSSVLSYIDRVIKQLLIWILQLFTVELRSINKLQPKIGPSMTSTWPFNNQQQKNTPKKRNSCCRHRLIFICPRGCSGPKMAFFFGNFFFLTCRSVNRLDVWNISEAESGKFGINRPIPRKSVGLFP